MEDFIAGNHLRGCALGQNCPFADGALRGKWAATDKMCRVDGRYAQRGDSVSTHSWERRFSGQNAAMLTKRLGEWSISRQHGTPASEINSPRKSVINCLSAKIFVNLRRFK